MADRRQLVPEIVRPGQRNGRHINHDPQSLRYLVAPRGVTVTPRTVRWERHSPTLNQGGLGTCVASSGVAALSTDPFWQTLPADLQQRLARASTAQEWAVELYRLTTAADPFPGAWEPEDTGTDGLSLAKVLRRLGIISGYEHITTLAAAHVGIQRGPFIIGTVWLSAMNTPDSAGVVSALGYDEGGHEYLCREYDADRDLWWMDNSWTDAWGVRGRFAMKSQTLATLLARQGDATQFVPLTAPAPQPAPAEPGGPVGPVSRVPVAPAVPPADVDAWAARTVASQWRSRRDRAAAQSYLDWRAQQ